MVRYICLFFILSFSYSGFKVGIDFNSEVEVEYMGESVEYDLDNPFSFGFQTLRGDGISYGVEYVTETEFEGSVIEGSLFSVYAFIPFYTSDSTSKLVISGVVGYSRPDLSFDSGSIDIDVEGGLMYGIEALFDNHYSLAMTFHNGDYTLDGFDGNVDFDVSRFTISYIF